MERLVAPADLEPPRRRLLPLPPLAPRSLASLSGSAARCTSRSRCLTCASSFSRCSSRLAGCALPTPTSALAGSLEGLLPSIVRRSLACVAAVRGEEVLDSDALNVVCVVTANLLTDAQLLARADYRLPALLGRECTRFLARSATGVSKQRAHPSETNDRSSTSRASARRR